MTLQEAIKEARDIAETCKDIEVRVSNLDGTRGSTKVADVKQSVNGNYIVRWFLTATEDLETMISDKFFVAYNKQ